jgi:hypothetical protein
MRKVALVVVVTLAICGTAVAASTLYFTGIYAGQTRQGLGIAMRVGRGEMKKMVYYANYRCADKFGHRYTDTDRKTTLGPAAINGNQEVNAAYNNGGEAVHLQFGLNHSKAAGWFKDAFFLDYNGHRLFCVTPGGQATVAGKVFFAMKHT